MVWKVEGFKYVKMGTKGVLLGYFEFSHAFGGKPCPRARPDPVPGPGSVSGRGHRRESVWPSCTQFFLNRVWIRVIGYGSTRYGLLGVDNYQFSTDPLRVRGWKDSDRNRCNGSDRTVVTVLWTVTTAPSNRFKVLISLFSKHTEQQSSPHWWRETEILNLCLLKTCSLSPFSYSEYSSILRQIFSEICLRPSFEILICEGTD